MSYSSYKSKYQNESRKVTPLAPMPANLQKQIQIEELGQKVDVILEHNQQLKDENEALKKKIVFMEGSGGNSIRGSSSRVGVNIPEKRQLQLKIIQIQQLKKQSIVEKQLFSVELDNLSSTLNIMTDRKNSLEMQKKELETRVFSLTADFQLAKHKFAESHKKQLQSQYLKKNVEKNQLINNMTKDFNNEIEGLKKEWQNEKNKLHQQKLEALTNLQNKCEKQIFKIRKNLEENSRQQINKIENAAIDKCRRERQKAQEYVQVMLENHKKNEEYDQEQLKQQIQDLKNSLDSRRKVIEGLLAAPSKPDNDRYYEEVQHLRKRIKEMTESFFRQAELLKVKMAIKHEADVKQVSKAYGDRLDIGQARIIALQLQNDRLRENYEQQIRNKLKLRQKFELQVSKLKNVIRKMKIELQSYGKQLRLNIDGIKDQANSFSMSMMTQLSQQKTKKTFFEEQMRKMREVLDMKEQQLGEIVKQTSQKVKYFEERVQQLKKKVQEQKEQLREKQQRYNHDMQEKDKWAKIQLQKEQNHLNQEIDHLLRQIEEEKEKYNDLKSELQKVKVQKKELQNEIHELHHQLDLSRAHIEALRLQMQMFAENVKPDEALKPLKEHYERIIEEMHKDKELLKEQNSIQAQRMTKLVAKYQDLQRTLQKTLSTMKKHSQLNQKVVELGMDNNLVKNLAQLFITNQD